MPRRNRQTRKSPSSGKPGSDWPGRTGDPGAFPEDSHKRWRPTSWGAGCGPELDSPPSRNGLRSGPAPRALEISAPSFEIGMPCPNCGFARLALDADERVSCPLCNFGGMCDGGD